MLVFGPKDLNYKNAKICGGSEVVCRDNMITW